MARELPRWMHFKHGRYYFVRGGVWHPLSQDRQSALIEYARLTATSVSSEFGQLVARAMDDMKRTVAAGTHKNYTYAANRILEAFAEFTPQQVRPVHVAQLMDDAKDTPSAANLLRSLLTNIFVRAVRWGIVESNPVRDIAPFKTGARDRYITLEEFLAIKSHATPTMQCMMDIAYITGQRIGDVRHMRYSDISDAGVFVKQQKTKERLLVEMTSDLQDAIDRAKAIHKSVKGLTLFHRRDGTPIPYTTLHYQWITACAKAKVENANFHDIRAAAATDAKEEGLDSKTLLGHTTEANHNRYLRSRKIRVATPNKARKI